MSDSDESTSEVTRTRVRRSRPSGAPTRTSRSGRAPRTRASRPLFLLGIGLILAGVGVLCWLAWEFWGTNVVSHHRQQEVSRAVEKGWHGGEDTVHTKFGDATAILHVPRFGKDYAVPVLEGDGEDVLAAGIAHFPHTADPGQAGNYALAAHRVTHGEPFADFPHLRKGDDVYVETRKATYHYKLDMNGTDLVVPMTDTWVIDRSPRNPDKGGIQPPPTDRLITLVTCSEIFHTDNRSVVFGHYVGIVKKKQPGSMDTPHAGAGSDSTGSLWWWLAGAAVLAVIMAWLIRRRKG